MKCKVVLVFAVLLFPLMVGAGSPVKSDYVSFGLSGGYSTLVGSYSGMDVYGGFGGGMHLGYEYREGKFWLGALSEFQYVSSNCKSDIQVADVRFRDTSDEVGTMHYEMNSRLREMQNFGIGSLCLMLGYSEATHVDGGFYAGAGVKVGCKFDFSNRIWLDYSTYATYDDCIDPYHDMPDHYYTDYHTNDTAVFGTKLNVSVVGEIGWDIKMTRCDKIKIGFFAEAGLTNVMRSVPVREPWVSADNVTVVHTYSAYNREAMQYKYIVPVMAGVRVSLLFNVSRLGEKCKTCPCDRKR